MRFAPITLKSKGFTGLTMNTADGNSSHLDSYVTFKMRVLGIWRVVHAVIRPTDHDKGDLSLLLGLPWLYDVDAKIGIKESIVVIGDQKKDEKSVELRGPLFVPSQQHKLMQHPKYPNPRKA